MRLLSFVEAVVECEGADLFFLRHFLLAVH